LTTMRAEVQGGRIHPLTRTKDKKMRISLNIGQTVLTYAIVLALVGLALGMMRTYMQRSIQAGIKRSADELGRQQDSVETDPQDVLPSWMQERRVDTSAEQILEDLSGAHILSVIESSEVIYRDSERLIDWEENND